MKNCCALRLLMRKAKLGAWRTLPDGDRFGCTKCGQSYIRRDGQWEPIRTADDILDMMAQEHARHDRSV